jgi:hypothetical protein
MLARSTNAYDVAMTVGLRISATVRPRIHFNFLRRSVIPG